MLLVIVRAAARILFPPRGSGHPATRTLFIGFAKPARAMRDASSLKQW